MSFKNTKIWLKIGIPIICIALVITVIFLLFIPAPLIINKYDSVEIDYTVWESDEAQTYDLLTPVFDATVWVNMIPITENDTTGLTLGLYNNLLGKGKFYESGLTWLNRCIDQNRDGIDDNTGQMALTYGNSTDQYFNTSLMIQFTILDILKFSPSVQFDNANYILVFRIIIIIILIILVVVVAILASYFIRGRIRKSREKPQFHYRKRGSYKSMVFKYGILAGSLTLISYLFLSVWLSYSPGEFNMMIVSYPSLIPFLNIYPYNSGPVETFDLSQNYYNAVNLEIMLAKGYYFNESEVNFDLGNVILQGDKKSIQITEPNGFELNNFEKIVVYLNFTEGAYSDYTQFRLKDNGFINHPEAPLWTKNDSIYVNYEYNDIDYFLLMEDYAVGSDDSLFEYSEYVRNGNFVSYNTLDSEYEVLKDMQLANFDNFTGKEDKRNTLEFYDSDLDGTHELVIQKEDVDVDGVYDVFRYGEVDPAGEIVFHTTLITIESSNTETQKASSVKRSNYYKIAGDDSIFGDSLQIMIANDGDFAWWWAGTLFGRRTMITDTTTTTTTTTSTIMVQKDLDLDGIIDKDITFESINTISVASTYTTEILGFYLDDIFSENHMFEGSLIEYRNSTVEMSDKSHTFTFRDYKNGEVSSTRIYEDIFPNELSDKYNLNNYLTTVINNNDDEDPSNDFVLQAPALESLLTFTHATDNVPALFDSKTTITSSIAMYNILATQKTVSIPDSRTNLYKTSSVLDIIQVIPVDGKVIVDSNPRYSPKEVSINGEYWYYSSGQDGIFDTVFVVNEDKEVLAIGFDYDYNSLFVPNKRIKSEKHLINTVVGGGHDFSSLGPQNRVYLRDTNSYDGNFMDNTFSDSLYDIWKMHYTSETSALMKEISAITSRQFVQTVTPRVVDDVLWQVGAGLFATIFMITSSTGPLGFLLMYGTLQAAHAREVAEENLQLIASQTFYNEDFEAEITLSSKKAYDELWGGTIPNILGGSTSGVYAGVYLETDRHIFKGDLLLAPQGIQKTDWMGNNVPISLDYAAQTRSYSGYSDINDTRLNAHLFTYEYPEGHHNEPGALDQVITEAGIDISAYNLNSVMHLENAISQETGGQYDTLYPYMLYDNNVFIPTFQFAGIDNAFPVPDFYHEYPIFVDLQSSSATPTFIVSDLYTIYKIFDINSPRDIDIVPDNGVHMIYSDVQRIDVYQYTTADLVMGYDQIVYDRKFIGSYYNNSFSFNKTQGILTIDKNVHSYLVSQAGALEVAHLGDPDYEVFYVFEIKIAKYQVLDPEDKKESHIATMQAVEQNILEYSYQYTHAQNTQQGLSEMFYTVFITTISTIITVGLTYGIGSFLKPSTGFVWDGTGWTFMDTLTTDVGVSTLVSHFAGVASQMSKISVLFSPIKESLQEIFVDPYLETIVSDIVASLGGGIALQVLFSSLVEGGRESITGPLSQFIFGDSQVNTQSLVTEQHVINVISQEESVVENAIENKKYSLKYSPQWSSIFKTGASLILGAALTAIGGPMFFGGTLASGFVALQSISQDVKIQKTIIHNIVSQSFSTDYNAKNNAEEIEIQVRAAGVHPDIALQKISAFSTQKVRDLLPKVYSAYEYNPLLNIYLVAGHTVLDPNLPLSKIHYRRPLTVVADMVGGATSTRIDATSIVNEMAEALYAKLVAKIPQKTLGDAILATFSEDALRQLLADKGIYRDKLRSWIIKSQESFNVLVEIATEAHILRNIIFQRSKMFSFTSKLTEIFNEFQHPYLFTEGFKRHYFTNRFGRGADFKANMIEQFQDFFISVQDPDITLESRNRLLNMMDIYSAQNNLPNYRQLRDKPVYTLLEAARKAFSKQEGSFIPMSNFIRRIVGSGMTQYSMIVQDQFGAIKVSNLWAYCKENILNQDDKAYIEGLVKAAGFYLDSIILTDSDSLKAPEIEIVAKLQDKLSVLNRWKNSNPSVRELTQYFGVDFSRVMSEYSHDRFKRVFFDNEIQIIKGKLHSDLLAISPRGYNDIIFMLNKYDSSNRVREIEHKYKTYQGWINNRDRKIYGDSDTVHPKVWNKPKFREAIRKVLFPRQGGHVTVENGESVYHIFDGFTGEVFTWRKLTLTPHKDLQSGNVVLVATNEEGVEIAIIHHIDFNKENNQLSNYLWIRSENHKTNLRDDAKRKYIAQGKIASLAFEYGLAPRFWSHEAQLRFIEAKRTNSGLFPSGDTIMIVGDSTNQLGLDHFLGNK